MKKLFSLALIGALLAIGGIAYAYDQPTYSTFEQKRNAGGGLGTPVRVLKLVRFSSTAANGPDIASRDVVVYDTVSDDGVTVILSTTSLDGAIAGVAVTAIQTSDATSGTDAQADAGQRNWGWIIVHGPTVVRVASPSISVGDKMVVSAESGVATTNQPVVGAATAANVNQAANAAAASGGFYLDAVTTGTTADVFVEQE